MGRGTRYHGRMKYAILRTQKLKSAVAVHRSMKHAFRAQDTPNADHERTPENTHIGANSVAEGMAAFRGALPEKLRKNGVLAIEYLMTASPEAMNCRTRTEQDAYFSDALDWLRERHGAENVIYAGIHRDEQTPHMYAYVVPKDPDTGRLNARRWLGGAKALSEMQTEFAERVGMPHGLERGIQGSKARHQTIQKHYAAINRGEKEKAQIRPQMLEPQRLEAKGLVEKIGLTKRIETPEMIAERLTNAVNEYFSGTVSIAAESAQNARRAREAEKTAKDMRDRLKPLVDALQPLNQQERAHVVGVFQQMTKNLQENKQKQQEQAREQRRNLQTEKSRDRNRGGGLEL